MQKIIIAFIPTFLIALGFIAYLENDKKSGDEVILQVVSRDPVDLLRGDFVNLNYAIENIEVGKIPNNFQDGELSYGNKICVLLDDSVTPAKEKNLIKKIDIDNYSDKKICGTYENQMSEFTQKYFDLKVEERDKISQAMHDENGGYNYEKMEKKWEELGYKAEQYDLSFAAINRFFIPKGTGYVIDKAARENKLTASIIVTKAGNSYVNYLLIDGKKVDFSTIEPRE